MLELGGWILRATTRRTIPTRVRSPEQVRDLVAPAASDPRGAYQLHCLCERVGMRGDLRPSSLALQVYQGLQTGRLELVRAGGVEVTISSRPSRVSPPAPALAPHPPPEPSPPKSEPRRAPDAEPDREPELHLAGTKPERIAIANSVMTGRLRVVAGREGHPIASTALRLRGADEIWVRYPEADFERLPKTKSVKATCHKAYPGIDELPKRWREVTWLGRPSLKTITAGIYDADPNSPIDGKYPVPKRSMVLEVYPDHRWSITIEVDSSLEREGKPELSAGIEAAVATDGQRWSVGWESESPSSGLMAVLGQKAIQDLWSFTDKIGLGWVDELSLALAIEAEWGWAEQDAPQTIAHEVKIKSSGRISASAELVQLVSVLSGATKVHLALSLAPPLTQLIQRIFKTSDLVPRAILELKVKGSFGLGLELTLQPGTSELAVKREGTIGAELRAGIETMIGFRGLQASADLSLSFGLGVDSSGIYVEARAAMEGVKVSLVVEISLEFRIFSVEASISREWEVIGAKEIEDRWYLTEAKPAGELRRARRGTAKEFVEVAKTQLGKPYIYGAEVRPDDPDPPAFDCSEFVGWAARQAGGRVNLDNSAAKILAHAQMAGLELPVAAALKVPGALLFWKGQKGVSHVAIAVGDGTTIDARDGESRCVAVHGPKVNKGATAAAFAPGIGYGR